MEDALQVAMDESCAQDIFALIFDSIFTTGSRVVEDLKYALENTLCDLIDLTLSTVAVIIDMIIFPYVVAAVGAYAGPFWMFLCLDAKFASLGKKKDAFYRAMEDEAKTQANKRAAIDPDDLGVDPRTLPVMLTHYSIRNHWLSPVSLTFSLESLAIW